MDSTMEIMIATDMESREKGLSGEMASTMETKTADTESNKQRLFGIAMKGEWEEVVKIYGDDPTVHKAKITRSGDTTLHIVVSDGQEATVEQLVNLICKNDGSKTALKIKNERGNTPLHLAASMGNVKMCECIAKVDSALVGARNKDGETPFFLAAVHGNTDAFLCLHNICGDKKAGEEYSRRNVNGDTILHCAISGDYFDLAYRIIHLYDKLVNSVNEKGFCPLDLLASKPSAFKSGSHLSWLDNIIYHCIFVDELKEEPLPKTSKVKKNSNCPENYQTCINIIRLMQNMIRGGEKSTNIPQEQKLLPSNYDTCFESVKLLSKAILVILGLGSTVIRKLRTKKEKHKWSIQIMNKLLQHTSMYQLEDDGKNPSITSPPNEVNETPPKPHTSSSEDQQLAASPAISSETNREDQNKGNNGKDKKGEGWDGFHISAKIGHNMPDLDSKPEFELKLSTPSGDWLYQAGSSDPWARQPMVGEKKSHDKRETTILIAAKNGVMEMVEKILELFPVAIHDMNSNKKNIVLLAVENRQPDVYELLHKRKILKDSVFHIVDNKGNSALHLAAMLGQYRPWLIPGAALQMQWEIKWYEYVKNSMPLHFFVHHNNDGKTPKDVFTDTHKELVKNGGEWLTSTSQSCSVVAALIATVAFTTSATVPGGIDQDNGLPTLKDQPAFNIFAISSLVALCFSVTAVVMFLAILTSRYQEKDFGKDLPRKLLLGLTSLFVSIASMLVSFCAGHFFVLKDKLKYATFPVYAVTCLPVTFFAIAQFPLYFDLIWATFKKVPRRSFQVVPP